MALALHGMDAVVVRECLACDPSCDFARVSKAAKKQTIWAMKRCERCELLLNSCSPATI